MKKQHTLTFRLFFVTLCIAALAIAMIYLVGVQNRKISKNEKLSENQAEVEVILSQMDTMIELLQNAMINCTVEDADFKTISAADTWTTDIWLANQRVSQIISSQTNITSMKVTPFVYYPKSDMFYNYQIEPAVTTVMKAQIENRDETPLLKGWHTFWADEKAYLGLIIDKNTYFLGAWIEYDSFFGQWNKLSQEGVRYCITDMNGNILQNAVDEKIDVTQKSYIDEDKNKWYISGASGSQADFYLVKMVTEKKMEADLSGVAGDIRLAAAIFTVLFFAYLLCMYRWIIIPVKHLRSSMEIIQLGNLSYRIPKLKATSEEFSTLIDEFNVLMDEVENLKIEMYEQKLEQNETKLEYLSRQIQPHFMLNTLNTLYNYSDSDVEITKKILKLISKYYRYVVNVNSRYVQLEQELEHIENYLGLQKIRYPKAFEYKVLCDEGLKVIPIPPFVIESFVGNAVKYGIIPGEMSLIQIEVSKITEFRICIQISDMVLFSTLNDAPFFTLNEADVA